MKKLGLTLVLFFGISIASYACDAARENLRYEIEQFGRFTSWADLMEAWADWVDVSC